MAINLNGYRITVLCEDKNQYDFISSYAKLLGATKINRLTHAHNNGTVLKYYPDAAKSYRKYATQNIVLAVMIDADEKTIQERLREFDEKLDIEKYKLNQNTRFDNEKILIFVPIRNIESWFYYIDTKNTDGETLKGSDGKLISYKNKYPNKDIDVNLFAKKLKEEICLNGLPKNAPSSLRHACNELDRLKN